MPYQPNDVYFCRRFNVPPFRAAPLQHLKPKLSPGEEEAFKLYVSTATARSRSPSG